MRPLPNPSMSVPSPFLLRLSSKSHSAGNSETEPKGAPTKKHSLQHPTPHLDLDESLLPGQELGTQA
jgi:hypothetical protein